MGRRAPLRSLLLTTGVVVPLAAVVIALAHGPWTAAPPADGAPRGGAREIAVRVHAWGFSPKVVRVGPGETVRFLVRSDDIAHGFAINELHMNLPLRPGREVRSPSVEMTLPEGTYAIHCSVFCGLGHPSMKARLVVGTPPPPPGARAPWIASLLTAGAVAAFSLVAGLRRRR